MEAALQDFLSSCGVALVTVPGKGRGLVTTKDFQPGDIIICQEPYASTPSNLFDSSNCDKCFISSGLKKCSACKIASYCGRKCQMSAWKLHRLECRALRELTEERRKLLTPTIRLVAKLILKRKLQDEQVIPSVATDNYQLVDALVSHMSELDEERLLLYAHMAYLVSLVLPSLNINIKETAELFAKLVCNGHTICDGELRPLGTGLYPVLSMINHSCAPNSVLLFDGEVAYVRALELIPEGTEVLFCYIATASTTKTRKEDLKQYYFTCKCFCCAKDPSQELEENAILEGFRCKDEKCSGFLLLESEKNTFICQQCGLSRDQQEIRNISAEVEELGIKAYQFLSCNYSETCSIYKVLEQLQCKLYHPLSLILLQTRETLFKILMESEDWRGALEYCQLTIPVYQRVYPTVHPMLGLQYYACGKLEWFPPNASTGMLLSLPSSPSVGNIQSYGKCLNALVIPYGNLLLSLSGHVYVRDSTKRRHLPSSTPLEGPEVGEKVTTSTLTKEPELPLPSSAKSAKTARAGKHKAPKKLARGKGGKTKKSPCPKVDMAKLAGILAEKNQKLAQEVTSLAAEPKGTIGGAAAELLDFEAIAKVLRDIHAKKREDTDGKEKKTPHASLPGMRKRTLMEMHLITSFLARSPVKGRKSLVMTEVAKLKKTLTTDLSARTMTIEINREMYKDDDPQPTGFQSIFSALLLQT